METMLTTLVPLLLFCAFPLPIGTDRRMRRVPWVTWSLIALNVIVYALTSSDPTVYDRLGLIPNRPAFHTLFTYQFVHVSIGHIFWNMYFLWLFGPHVEDALGRVTFIALYLGGGVAAGLLHMAISLILAGHGVLEAPLVGASGAISSVLAPFAIRFHRAQIRLFWLPGLLIPGGWSRLEMPALWGLSVWLLQNVGGAAKSVIAPEQGGTAYWAHIGGFVFGLIAAYLTGLLQEGHRDYLLQDARASLGRGHDLLSEAIQRYRLFLDHDPDNAPVRVELARALAQSHPQGEAGREEAAVEMLAAVRLFQKQSRLPEAVQACAEAQSLGLALPLPPRDRLRLSRTAEEAGASDTAARLLRALIEETPDAPEDEMARLRLGQLLLPARPDEARDVLSSFLDRYPESAWTRRAQELLQQTHV
jgi:membrane associated rhomboid family serine protease